MNYSIKTIPQFDKQLKQMVKKYPSFRDDFINFIQSLWQKPELGTPIGKNCYKIRIAISAKNKGKSGGARVVTNFVITDNIFKLLAIYDKSDKETITGKELNELPKYVPVE